MFTCHRLSAANKLDCPHAMGTNAFSPQSAESFRNFLLLPSPHSTPSLRSVAQGRLRLLTTDASRRIFESALECVRRSFRLQVYGYAVMPEHVHLQLSEPQQDTSGCRPAPLKPKSGLSGPPDRQTKLPPHAMEADAFWPLCNRLSGTMEIESE